MLAMSLLGVVLIAMAGLVLARQRAAGLAGGELSSLHSRPSYHGLFTLLVVLIAGVVVHVALRVLGNWYVGSALDGALTELDPTIVGLQAETVLADARALVAGGITSAEDALRTELAKVFASVDATRTWVVAIGTILAALAATYWALSKIAVGFRARNRSELIVRRIL